MMSPNEPQSPKRTSDERIDALTMNLELQRGLQRDSDARISARIDKVIAAIKIDAENIRALVRIAEIAVEGGSPAH